MKSELTTPRGVSCLLWHWLKDEPIRAQDIVESVQSTRRISRSLDVTKTSFVLQWGSLKRVAMPTLLPDSTWS